jgi:hypothetical protein
LPHDPPPGAPVIVGMTALFGGARLSIQFDQAMENVAVDPTNWIWQIADESNWTGASFVMWRSVDQLWIDGTPGFMIPPASLGSYLATVPDVRSALLVPCAQTLDFPVS